MPQTSCTILNQRTPRGWLPHMELFLTNPFAIRQLPGRLRFAPIVPYAMLLVLTFSNRP
jgi:hypothetical protein